MMSEPRIDHRSEESPYESRPLGELVRSLSRNTARLLEGEVRLAKAELESKVHQAKVETAKAAVGGAVVYAGALCLVATATLLLWQIMALWLATLCVGVALTVVGGVLLSRGSKNVSGLSPVPQRAARNLNQDYQTTKEAIQ